MNLLFHKGKQTRAILSHDWKVLSFNPSISKAFHSIYKKQLKSGTYLKDYIDIPLISFFPESFQSALEGEEVTRKKLIKIKDEDHWFQFSFFPLHTGLDNDFQVLYISEDVTDSFLKEREISQIEKERIEQEKYLKNSEDKWRSLVESSPNIIFTLDKNFIITYINYSISGLKIQDVVGSDFLKYIQPDDLQNITKYLHECLNKGIIREFEIRGNVNGSLTAWYSTRIAPIRNNLTGEIESLIGTAVEITEKKTFQNKILESEEKFRTMADNAPVLIWISDTTGSYNFFNKPWLEFTGKNMDEELVNGWVAGIHPEDSDSRTNIFKNSLLKRQSFEIEYRLKRYDGEYRWLLDRGIPFIASNGNFLGFIGSCIDITARKQIESDIKSSLEEKEILLKEIHHRVKNNLQIISSLLSLQSNQLEDPSIIKIFQTNINRVKSIALLHDMLNLSSDQIKINFRDYLKLIMNYLGMIHDSGSNHIEMNLIADEIIITIDLAIYYGLIANELISNSLKYAFPEEKKGKISVQAKWEDGGKAISLIISDDGIGFPSEIKITEAKTLGLKLVNMLTRQMNGSLSIEKKTGLSFQFFLPVDSEKHRSK